MTKIIQKRRVFNGRVTRVDEVDLHFENGKKATYEVISFGVVTGVSALPVVDTEVILIDHYLVGIERNGLSIPTGGLNTGEKPEERIQWELQEEIGMKAGKLSLMFQSYAMPGYFASEASYTFLAEELVPSRLHGDEEYDIALVRMPLTKALELIRTGEILDARTVSALLYYDRFRRTLLKA